MGCVFSDISGGAVLEIVNSQDVVCRAYIKNDPHFTVMGVGKLTVQPN